MITRCNNSKNIITEFLKSDKVVCVEFTEVNSLLDNKGNKMEETNSLRYFELLL